MLTFPPKRAEVLIGRFLTHGGSNCYWLGRIVLDPDTEDGFLIAANCADSGGGAAVADVEKALTPTIVGRP